jgi:predicted ATPase
MLRVYDKLVEYDEMTIDKRERRGLKQLLDALAAILVENVESEYDRLLCFDDIVVTDVADTRPTQGTLERLMAAGVIVLLTANRPSHQTDRGHLRVIEDLQSGFWDFSMRAVCVRGLKMSLVTDTKYVRLMSPR